MKNSLRAVAEFLAWALVGFQAFLAARCLVEYYRPSDEAHRATPFAGAIVLLLVLSPVVLGILVNDVRGLGRLGGPPGSPRRVATRLRLVLAGFSLVALASFFVWPLVAAAFLKPS